MSKPFTDMTIEELRKQMNEHQDNETGELAYLEYRSRLDWKKVSAFASPEAEKRIIERIISEKCQSK